jgi:alpha-ketoglutarate-dependent taurine dioxygenase
MNYHLHENGWTVILDNFDFKTATQADINQIAKLVATNTCVVAKEQKLTVADQVRIAKMFKNPNPLFTPDDPDFIHCAADLTQDPTGIVCRVSGALNDHGMPGIAGHIDEMQWHCNHPYRFNRSPMVWLYGEAGTLGSRTSWNNNILSYNDLDQTTKDKLSNLKCIYYGGTQHTESYRNDNNFKDSKFIVEDFTPSLVYTNNAGKTGLYFSLLQLERFVGMTREESLEIATPLFEHTIQDKYCYHHDWNDGDVIISEQWLGIHKRWRFEDIATRVLHRTVFDFPDQDYT